MSETGRSATPKDTAGRGPLGAGAPDTAQEREDDGLFGPESISWRVFADPSSKLGGVAAILLQALNPGMMRLFSSLSVMDTDPIGRAERTARYIDTTVFGDVAHAEAAGASVRRMHAHATWTDERTGETYAADTAAWLVWTHNTIVWGVLRGADAYGPDLTPAEQDRLVLEQHRAAELVGIDTSTLASTRAELDAYIEDQVDWLAVTLPAAEITANLRKPSLKGNPVKVATALVIQDGIIALLPGWAMTLYGIEGRPMNLGFARRATRAALATSRRNAPYQKLLSDMLTRVDTHPYRKVRKKLN